MKRLPSLLLAATLAATSAHAVSIFHESFDGNDQNWSYTSSADRSYDNTGWAEADTVKPGYKGVKLGSTSATGTITSPSFALNNRSKSVVITIVAAAYTHSGGGKEGIALAVYDDSNTSIFTDSVEELTQFSSTVKDEIPANATFTQTFTIPAASLPATGNIHLSITSTYTVSGQRRALIGDVLVEQDPLPALSAPDNLDVDGDVGTTEFTVTWNAVTDATGYRVTLSDENGSNEITSFETYLGDETATFIGLSASTTYLVSVVAKGDGTTFVDSPAATRFVTTADPAFSLTTPYYLTVDSASITPVSFTASWTGDANAEEYEVEAYEKRTITLDFNQETLGSQSWVANKSGSIEISPTKSITWTASTGRVYGTDSLESPDGVPNPALTVKSGETLTIGPLD